MNPFPRRSQPNHFLPDSIFKRLYCLCAITHSTMLPAYEPLGTDTLHPLHSYHFSNPFLALTLDSFSLGKPELLSSHSHPIRSCPEKVVLAQPKKMDILPQYSLLFLSHISSTLSQSLFHVEVPILRDEQAQAIVFIS